MDVGDTIDNFIGEDYAHFETVAAVHYPSRKFISNMIKSKWMMKTVRTTYVYTSAVGVGAIFDGETDPGATLSDGPISARSTGSNKSPLRVPMTATATYIAKKYRTYSSITLNPSARQPTIVEAILSMVGTKTHQRAYLIRASRLPVP